jgi:hypothetical protein
MPDLRVVPLESLVLHEDADERRVKNLVQRLSVEQVVKNPPVVADLEPGTELGRFVVLDGANRVSALREIGVRDAVVQVVDYDRVTLTSWFHLLAGLEPEELESRIRTAPGVGRTALALDAAKEALRDRKIVAIFVESSGDVYAIEGGLTLAEQTARLSSVVATYRGSADIFRVQSDDIDELRGFFSEIAGLVIFPPYSPSDIRQLARAAIKLPTGITRHLIPDRALRLHTELALLWGEAPLGEKNRWLSEWTRHKLQSREIRRYEEPTVLFDE